MHPPCDFRTPVDHSAQSFSIFLAIWQCVSLCQFQRKLSFLPWKYNVIPNLTFYRIPLYCSIFIRTFTYQDIFSLKTLLDPSSLRKLGVKPVRWIIYRVLIGCWEKCLICGFGLPECMLNKGQWSSHRYKCVVQTFHTRTDVVHTIC